MNLDYLVQDIVDSELNNGIKKHISKIHPEINFRYNSFNICVGNQSSSKTTSVLKELIKLSLIENDYHLIVYVTNNDSDDTFNSLKSYITIPIVKTDYQKAEKQFEKLFQLKDAYNSIVDNNLSDSEDSDEEEKNKSLLDALNVEDFSKKRLHTFILFDDASFIFDKNTKSNFKRWLTQCRHFNITVFCNIQIWNSMDPKLKSQLSSVFLFGGFSRERLQYIYRQVPIDMSFEEFWEMYINLNKYEKLIIDCQEASVKHSI